MAFSRGKTKFRCRNLDRLRKPLYFINQGDLEGFKSSLLKENMATLFQERLLLPRVPENQSPLVLAAQSNQEDVMKYILDSYQVNIEQETATVIEGGHPVEGATPLWTASTLGHMKLVVELVSRGASIEHTTDSHSTPLRGAAFDGHLDVVEYLISKGADIDKPNQVGQSPLTIAAAMQKVDTVKFLLEKGANIYHQGHNGDTPLHVAVESGSKEVTKVLVEAGAKNTPNDVGYTPAILASCYGHFEIMEYLHTIFSFEPKELYDCYCLLFTKEVLNGNVQASYKWIKKAVEIRMGNPVQLKDLPAAHPIYDGVQEPSTMSQVEIILADDIQSFYLCSLYCERILGDVHPTTAFYIRISGDMALEEKDYSKCMQLWVRSLKFDRAARMAYELQITEDLLFCIRGFSTMINNGYLPEIYEHFLWGVREFKMAKESKISEADVACCLCRMLAIWIKVTEHREGQRKKEEEQRIVEAAHELYSLMDEKGNPLLLACLQNPPRCRAAHHISASQSISVCKLPLEKVVALLLDIGCSVHSEDHLGNYPLHLAAKLMEDSAMNCIKTLLEYGSHLDAVNHLNETALQVALNMSSNVSPNILHQRNEIVSHLKSMVVKSTSLQCLSAVAVVKNKVAYVGVLPHQVASFVSRHEADDSDTETGSNATDNSSTD